MSNKNCLNCKFDCQGQCKKIDTEDEGIGYEVDEFSTEFRSPLMKVIDQHPAFEQ